MSVLCERAVDEGLGQHMDTLDASRIKSYYNVSGMSHRR
jgi:hypothetical protein